MTDRPTLEFGDRGSDVMLLQECLSVPIDAQFGGVTESAVEKFQKKHHIEADGVVGPETWTMLGEDFDLPPYPPRLIALPDKLVREIREVALKSSIAEYSWRDRGQAPAGYIAGMALAYAIMVERYRSEDDYLADELARAATNDGDRDALAWYGPELRAAGIRVDVPGLDALRALYTLQMGLGMRESSGRHCEGRDLSADNTSATSAEAGLFQQSWDSRGCSTSLQSLFDAYDGANPALGYEEIFSEEVSCSDDEWSCYGSGDGYKFQAMAKGMPLFAVDCAAVALRWLRQHFGPINRKEVEVKREAYDLFLAIERLLPDRPTAEPEPEPQPLPQPVPPAPGIPGWLLIMRTITGTTEAPGDEDNPKILAMAELIGLAYPEMASYCQQYSADSIAWCGLTVAFCCAMAGIRPPFGPTDTDKFLWAQSFADPADAIEFEEIDEPRLGCIVVMTREGGGHVTLFEEEDSNGNYRCRGGNQSDSVNVQTYDPETVIALMWPRGR